MMRQHLLSSTGEDPEKALDFAGNLLSFLSFITDLLGRSAEVFNGPPDLPNTPGTANNEESLTGIHDGMINKYYCRLYEEDLTTRGRAHQRLWPDVDAFNDVADTCRDDFEKLNKLLKTVRQSNRDSTRWPSFREALHSHWYPNEVSDLEERCSRCWTMLTQHVCSFSGYWTKQYQQFCNDIRGANSRHREDIPEHFRNQIDTSPQFEFMSRLIHEIFDRLHGIEQTRKVSCEDMEFFETGFTSLKAAQNTIRGGNIIIESLAFDGYDTQVKSIPTATDPMFKWAFSSSEGPDSPRSGSDLKRWLRQGYGMGLVTGESGCGKSMLMKHLSTHPDLGGTLYQWSNPRPVIVASHFFSAIGTTLQRSWQGMLRTLLRTLLLQLPGDAEAIYGKHNSSYPEKLRDYHWSTNELERHLLEIMASHKDVKFCFFIDGLEDYDGDMAKLADFMQRLLLAGHGNSKLCLSSTRDDVKSLFRLSVSHFAIDRNFLLKDLEIYLGERLKSHPLLQDHATATKRKEVARMAANKYQNFLWGRIAVDHLRSRHRTEHTFEDVKRALEELPPQPPSLVKHCLRATPVSLAQSGAYFFLVALGAKEPPPLAVYHFLTTEQQDSDFALKLDHKALNQSEQDGIRRSARDGLGKRCGSFLQERSDFRVGFPHVALRDIFGGSEVLGALRAKASPKHHVHLSLARAYLAYMKTHKLSWGRPTFSYSYLRNPPFLKIFGEFLANAREIDTSHRMHQLLDDWEACFKSKSQTDQQALTAADRAEANTSQHFRKPILEALLSGYVDYKVRRQPTFLKKRDQSRDLYRPPLSVVLCSMFDTPASKRGDHMKMLRCLFRHGSDPNEVHRYGGPTFTPWTDLVRRTSRHAELVWSLDSGVISLFLSHGANPNTPVWDGHPSILGSIRRSFTSSWVVLVFYVGGMLHSKEMLLNEAEQRACLNMMAELCQFGASAQSHPSCNFFDSPEPCSNTAWAEALVLYLLDVGSGNDGSPSALQLGLVEHILLILVRSGLGVDWSWDVLQRFSSPELLELIKERIFRERIVLENGTAPTTNGSNLGKRSSDEMVTDSESPSKRSRSETSDETMTMTMTMRMETGPV